ncbi:hypothetical protein KM043_003938 [Ampulex compressa]|nr:hypothetical protein KM043_003938 [Ampulex compressa]
MGLGRKRQRRVAGLDEKGPNLFSGRPSTPPPAKRPTTVWPSSYNPYYPKRTERPPPPSEERVERPEQKLRGSHSTAPLGEKSRRVTEICQLAGKFPSITAGSITGVCKALTTE